MGTGEDESRCLEDLMRELSVGDGKTNPFKLFARRAQLVITGLVHISILLLPKPVDGALPSQKPGSGVSSSSSGSTSRAGGAGAPAGNGSGPKASAAGNGLPPHAVLAEMEASGAFPADGSDLEHWDRVQHLLEQTSTSRLDWSNCCVYDLSEAQGATVQPIPSYPVSCTAGYYAAEIKGDVLISNDFESKGPHFADWRTLYEAGARSMAAAPMYVQQKIVGVLNLASKDPHAFDRSRLVWLMAVVLSPFVSVLEYATQRLEMDAFIKRIMPPLLEQNYVRNTSLKRPAAAGSGGGKAGAGGGLLARLFGDGDSGKSGDGGGPPAATEDGLPSESAVSPSERGARMPLGQPPRSPVGSDQFAHNAEVLITSAVAGSGMAAPLSGSYLTLGSEGSDSCMTKPAASSTSPPGPAGGRSRAGRANGKRTSGGHSGSASAAEGAASPRPGSAAGDAPCDSGAATAAAAAAPAAGPLAAKVSTSPAAAPAAAPAPTTTPATAAAAGAAGGGYDSLEPYLASYDSDLDWGDFFFNLISMCIVYAYFSEAAVAGESQAAIVVSMCIAAIDIVLLALRWLWYEQYITYGGAVLQVFQMYRLVVLPVANTWMSWSLLHKLGITPGAAVVAGIGALVVVFLVLGVQMRFFLHAPLQLASVLFAASSTTDVCSRFLSSTTGLGCMSLVSLLQLSVGVVIPSLMVHVLDMRATDKPYLPHVQAKRWLLHP